MEKTLKQTHSQSLQSLILTISAVQLSISFSKNKNPSRHQQGTQIIITKEIICLRLCQNIRLSLNSIPTDEWKVKNDPDQSKLNLNDYSGGGVIEKHCIQKFDLQTSEITWIQIAIWGDK